LAGFVSSKGPVALKTELLANRVTEQMSSEGKKVRILIVDDNLFVRQQLRDLLAAHTAWEVCGEGADGVDAIHKVRELSPDVVVMDLSMPVMNGLRATQEITTAVPGTPIVMFSMYLSPHFTDSARAVGARGAVSKSEPQQIIRAVETLLAGKTFFPERGPGGSDTARMAPGA
jgi:two-component system, NarL family, nitrate/nitrite response regulator NarL